ncbi:DUF726 domain-containing protein [Corynebacterium cystitidis]|uniref:DUF726 domain-containing protein n=1 Tax=Corynebacterium cystitidis TaxID=35757 RepID=UPI0012FE6E49|nr:DUF726 domain-containing protein [Corynebacterium cystitidis]
MPRNIVRAGTTVAVAGGSSFLVAGAAPAIGGALGSLKGLSGAAATNHGLALLGGGAKAAGGLGMAGGHIVVSTLGTTITGATGLRVVNAYVNEDKSFGVEKKRDGTGVPVIFASGFTTDKKDNWCDWERLIDTCYPNSPVYQVTWGASSALLLGISGTKNIARKVLKEGSTRLAKRASKLANQQLGPLAAVGATAAAIANPWHTSQHRAFRAGSALAAILEKTRFDDGFVLIGHSLGGALMAKATEELGKLGKDSALRTVHLLAPAFPASRDVLPLVAGVSGSVFNYRSRNDHALKTLYRVANIRQAAGHLGFFATDKKLVEIDCTDTVSDHSAYFHSRFTLAEDVGPV